MATLNNSSRQLLKATYVPITFDQPSDKLTQAHLKAALVRGLQLQSGEVDAVLSAAATAAPASIPDPVWSVLKHFEPQPVAALAPRASVLADIPSDHLRTFAQAILDRRTGQLRTVDQPNPTAANPSGGVSEA